MPSLPGTHFYFTDVDPDYSIKGSRDPLGFQVLWQEQAKALIPYLSTVSGNLRDFQILALAYYFYPHEEAQTGAFIKFFIRWEQLMGYARWELGERQFGGRRRVARVMHEDPAYFSISNAPKDEILSSQRAYGVWAKYNRPFRDMGITRHPQFQTLFSAKLAAHPHRAALEKLIHSIIEKASGLRVAREQLQLLLPLLKFTRGEKPFYNTQILQLPHPNAPQNQLFQFLQTQKEVPNPRSLYSFLQGFKASSFARQDAGLTQILTEIEATEKILCPLNRIFRYLQTRPLWSRQDLEGDAFLQHCQQKQAYSFSPGTKDGLTKNALSATLSKAPWALIEDFVKRNKEVTAQRGGAAWVSVSEDVLEVHHRQGAMEAHEFDSERDADNFYFIDTYVSLYHQIMA